MPSHQNTSENHPDQGMTPADMRATVDVCKARNEVIMFRSTGAWSRPLIAAGHPTKPFHVKGKSADWGPQAGFVPHDSEYSKAVLQKDVDKGRAENAKSINGNYARPVPLYITEWHIQENLLPALGINDLPPILRMSEPRPGVRYFFCRKTDDNGDYTPTQYVMMGKQTSSGTWEIFAMPPEAGTARANTLFLMESKAVPLTVMATPGSDLPITGDYDLFAVCPSWNAYGAMDQKMDRTLDDPHTNNSNRRTFGRAMMVTMPGTADFAARNRAVVDLQRLRDARTAEDEHRGNLTPRIAAALADLRAKMGPPSTNSPKAYEPSKYRGVNFPRVHHNAESGRPFAPGAADGFPVTTFHPGPIGPYTFHNATITTENELRDYFMILYASGYYPPRNRAWNMSNVNQIMNNAGFRNRLSQLLTRGH